MRLTAIMAVVGLSVLSVAACTDPPSAPTGSATPPALSVATTKPSATDTPSSAQASAPPGTSPYHLEIPADDQRELYRWVSGERGGTVLFDDVRKGHRYRIEGACIYGYGDQLSYRALDARASRMPNRTITRGAIRCDGRPHVQVLRAAVSTPIELLPGPMGDKTVAYLRLLPVRT